MNQVFAIRQVCEKYLANGKMYSVLLWILRRHMIRLIGMVRSRCQECMGLEKNC